MIFYPQITQILSQICTNFDTDKSIVFSSLRVFIFALTSFSLFIRANQSHRCYLRAIWLMEHGLHGCNRL